MDHLNDYILPIVDQDDGLQQRLAVTRKGALEVGLPAALASELPAAVRKLPVLSGMFAGIDGRLDLDQAPETDWGSVELIPGLHAIAFRARYGPHVLYWLGNACDPVLWTAMDRWEAAGRILIAPMREDGSGGMSSAGFGIGKNMTSLRESVRGHEQSKRPFLSAASQFLQTGLERLVRADVRDQALESVQGCIVVTPNTGLPDVALPVVSLSLLYRVREAQEVAVAGNRQPDAMTRRPVPAAGGPRRESDDGLARSARKWLEVSRRPSGKKAVH